MADLTPEQAIEKLRGLPEDKQRAVLTALGPEERKGILAVLSKPAKKTPGKMITDQKPTVGSVARSAALGAFEGAGIAPSTTPVGVLKETAKQLSKGAMDFVGETYRRNNPKWARLSPGLPILATAIDLVPAFIDRTATALEAGGRESFAAGKRGDVEEATEKGVSTLTSAALLKGGREATEDLSKVGQLRKAAREGIHPTARKITGVEPAVKEAVTKAAEKHGSALAEHAETAKNVAEREALAKTVDTKSAELGKKLESVQSAVYKEADKKFKAVKAAVGNPEVAPTELVGTIKDIEANTLQGIPENVKEFRSILGHEGKPFKDDLAAEISETLPEDFGAELAGDKPITWDKLQSLKSRLDKRLRNARGMNGDLKRGLRQAREAVVGTMGGMAESAGAGRLWSEARDFWRQYKEDFEEPTGPSGSGSPVAQSLDAVDPKNIRQPFLRTQSSIGNRGTQILRKYPQFGGNEAAALADEVVGHHRALQESPNKPKGFSADKPPVPPTVDVNRVARDAIAQRAKNWGSFNARDIGILASGYLGGLIEHVFTGGGGAFPVAVTAYEGTKYAASRALNKPGVIEWLAKTPQAEIDVINKIPGADKIKIIDGITQQAIQNAKSGKPTFLSPAAKQLLGPANVAKILAVNSANVARTPGDARNRMRKFAPTP